MSDNVQGAILLAIFLALVFAASRVLARVTGARYARAMAPLTPVIEGTFATDSLSHGWIKGTFGGRTVLAASTPGVQAFGDGGSANRYNAFDVEVGDVAGAEDWTVTYGSHGVGQILSRNESWRITADAALQDRLERSGLIAELERFAGAGVRGYPTVIYRAGQKTLTHRDNVSPATAPPPEHFRRQLELALRLAQINEQANPPVPAGR
jgi:hypothetical protein